MSNMDNKARKRKQVDSGRDDDGPPPSKAKATVGMQTSFIKNKQVRSEKYAELKHKDKKEKKKLRKKRQEENAKAESLGLEKPHKNTQKTIENTREKDETIVQPDDDEVMADEQQDEFAAHFNRDRSPQILVTTCRNPSKVMFTFLEDLLTVMPSCHYYARKDYEIKKIVDYAKNREFTDILVVNENHKKVNGVLIIHLPDGPTAWFRLSNYVHSKDIRGHGRATSHKPELILNNFATRLGHRIGRMFASLFPQDPQFRGRRAVTFHNQRDFIFFRHHRYIFEEKEEKDKTKKKTKKKVIARLQELGPRFTLKLQWVQKGTFDTKHGEYEWVKRSEMDTSRRRFFL